MFHLTLCPGKTTRCLLDSAALATLTALPIGRGAAVTGAGAGEARARQQCIGKCSNIRALDVGTEERRVGCVANESGAGCGVPGGPGGSGEERWPRAGPVSALGGVAGRLLDRVGVCWAEDGKARWRGPRADHVGVGDTGDFVSCGDPAGYIDSSSNAGDIGSGDGGSGDLVNCRVLAGSADSSNGSDGPLGVGGLADRGFDVQAGSGLNLGTPAGVVGAEGSAPLPALSSGALSVVPGESDGRLAVAEPIGCRGRPASLETAEGTGHSERRGRGDFSTNSGRRARDGDDCDPPVEDGVGSAGRKDMKELEAGL